MISTIFPLKFKFFRKLGTVFFLTLTGCMYIQSAQNPTFSLRNRTIRTQTLIKRVKLEIVYLA